MIIISVWGITQKIPRSARDDRSRWEGRWWQGKNAAQPHFSPATTIKMETCHPERSEGSQSLLRCFDNTLPHRTIHLYPRCYDGPGQF